MIKFKIDNCSPYTFHIIKLITTDSKSTTRTSCEWNHGILEKLFIAINGIASTIGPRCIAAGKRAIDFRNTHRNMHPVSYVVCSRYTSF